MEHLRQLIREVPDFPKQGINFYDITTLLKDADGLRQTIDALAEHIKANRLTRLSASNRADLFLPRRLLII